MYLYKESINPVLTQYKESINPVLYLYKDSINPILSLYKESINPVMYLYKGNISDSEVHLSIHCHWSFVCTDGAARYSMVLYIVVPYRTVRYSVVLYIHCSTAGPD